MTFTGERADRKMCRAASMALCMMHIFSNIAQIYVETDGFSESIARREVPLFSFWITVSLSPILAVFLARRSCIQLGVMAIPIVAIFCGRIYYDWLFLDSGQLIQKGDWAMWLNSFLGLICVAMVAAWTCVHMVVAVVEFFDRAIRNLRG